MEGAKTQIWKEAATKPEKTVYSRKVGQTTL